LRHSVVMAIWRMHSDRIYSLAKVNEKHFCVFFDNR